MVQAIANKYLGIQGMNFGIFFVVLDLIYVVLDLGTPDLPQVIYMWSGSFWDAQNNFTVASESDDEVHWIIGSDGKANTYVLLVSLHPFSHLIGVNLL